MRRSISLVVTVTPGAAGKNPGAAGKNPGAAGKAYRTRRKANNCGEPSRSRPAVRQFLDPGGPKNFQVAPRLSGVMDGVGGACPIRGAVGSNPFGWAKGGWNRSARNLYATTTNCADDAQYFGRENST